MLSAETPWRGADHRVRRGGRTDPAPATGRGRGGTRQRGHGAHQARRVFRDRPHVGSSLGEPRSVGFRGPVRAAHQRRRRPGEPGRQGNTVLSAPCGTGAPRSGRLGAGCRHPPRRDRRSGEVPRRGGKESVRWKVRELTAEETHQLRRSVSADGRTDLPSMHHDLDNAPGTWHLGAVDDAGRVVAISTFYLDPFPPRPEARPAVQLAFMAVDPVVQGQGIGSAVMSDAIRRLKARDAVLLWANARDSALPFYEKFGFQTVPKSEYAL